MDRIFLAARHLFIWLGKAYERIIRESVATNGSTLHVLRPVWEAPWFQRRWVIQEANVKFKERSIITNATLLNISNLQDMVTGTVDAEWFSTSPLAETLKKPLLAQLLRYEDALCRDPRDLIYALSNISSDKLAIVPDYTKSPDEVFIDLGVYCVASGQVLPLMACAIARPLSIDKQYAAGDSLRCIGQGRAQNRQLISWIPDWRLSRRKIPKKEHFSFSMCETAGQLPQIWHEDALVPSHTMQARVTHYPMANTLVIQGWLLGPYKTPKTLQHYRQESHQYDYISYRLRAEWQIIKINRKLSESIESSTLKMLCLPHTNFTFLVQQVRPCADPHGRPIHLYRLVTYFLRESSRLMDGFSDRDLGKFISMNAPKLAFLWDERNQFPGYENAKLPDPEEVYII